MKIKEFIQFKNPQVCLGCGQIVKNRKKLAYCFEGQEKIIENKIRKDFILNGFSGRA